ncbi:MAG: methyltransferase [Gaiellales bacterium]
MSDALPPEAQVIGTLCGLNVSQALYVAAELGVADELRDGPRPIDQVAGAVGADAGALRRILRTLAMTGCFSEVERGIFANTPQSETLRSDVPNSVRDLVLWVGAEPHWRVWGNLLDAVRTGQPAWEQVHGTPLFPYLFGENPALGATFERAMTSFSNATIPAILAAYDFSDATLIADIAGGYGHTLAAILQANPQARGILFDVPDVLQAAPAQLEADGVADRVELVPGDFEVAVPAGADLYLLKHVIHDWYDERARGILANVRDAMGETGRILIADIVLPEGDAPHFGKIEDLEMLLIPGGIERTEVEFRELVESIGLTVARVVPTSSLITLVEVVRA